MIPLVQIVTEIAQLAEDSSTAAQTKIKAWTNQWYERMWRSHNWKEIMIIDEALSVDSATQVVTIPKEFDQLIAITERNSNIILTRRSPYVYQEQYLSQQAATAGPIGFTPDSSVGTLVVPGAATTLKLTSTSTLDVQNARFYGIDSIGNVNSEQVTMNGVTAVPSTISFASKIKVVLASPAVGTITLAESDDTELAEIEPGTYTSSYMRVKLNASTDAGYTFYLTGKKSFRRLVNDEDTTEFPCESALVRFVSSEFQRIRKRYDQAKEMERIGYQFIEDLVTEKDILETAPIYPNVAVGEQAIDYPIQAGGKW